MSHKKRGVGGRCRDWVSKRGGGSGERLEEEQLGDKDEKSVWSILGPHAKACESDEEGAAKFRGEFREQ